MLLTSAFIASSAIYAGSKVYKKFNKKKKTFRAVLAKEMAHKQRPKEADSSLALHVNGKTTLTKLQAGKITALFEDVRHQLRRGFLASLSDSELRTSDEWVNLNFAISTVSLGLAAGALFYPVLGFVSVAGLVYLTLPVCQKAYHSLVKEHRVTAMTIWTIFLPSHVLSGHILAAAVSYWFAYLALNLASNAKGRTLNNMVNVFGEQPRSVWVSRDGYEIEIPFETVQIDDLVIVQAGEMIPADGTIVEGLAGIDQRMLTGQSQPAEKGIGDAAFAATVVLSGRIGIRFEKTGAATVAAQIGHILNQTTDYAVSVELRGVETADRFALPNLMLSALALPVSGSVGALAILWLPLGDVLYMGGPLGVSNYMSIAARQGLLIKDGRALELLRQVDTIVFDKTGTLTQEQPHVGKVYTCHHYTEDETLTFAAAAEHKQTHPIALAIQQAAQERQLDLPAIDEAQYEVGYGLKVLVDRQVIRVGSASFMALEEIPTPDAIRAVQTDSHAQGHSLVYVAVDDQLAGAVELHATIRPEAKRIIQELKRRDYSLYIISGDHEKPTQALAHELGIDDYFAETLPENKAALIAQLQEAGKSVCFIGDGINDAIALKQAQVSVSLRGASALATDTAQVILMNGSLSQLVHLFDLAEDLDANLRSTLLVGIVPSVAIVGGVFFLHFGLYSAITLNMAGMIASFGNAMWPVVKDSRLFGIFRSRNFLSKQ
jgi:heavy metal translocating P-type ATPase